MKATRSVTKIAVTTGDLDGIGLEVTLKALLQTPAKQNVQYCVYRNKATPSSLKKIEARLLKHMSNKNLEFIFRDTTPPFWIQEAAEACLSGEYQAMCTAPISKEIIVSSGIPGIGHTDILKAISKTPNVNMGFIGQHFNVVLATAHIPLTAISEKLTLGALRIAINSANRLRKILPAAKSSRPIALLGLNPHAGEGGIIGHEETALFIPVIKAARLNKIPLIGPLVPDAAFFKENWNKYSVFVCPYHDQGLIPFKMIHGRESGVHLTLGLPFVRTSVDHGTAKDIFGKNRASPQSMLDALALAVTLSRKAKNGI